MSVHIFPLSRFPLSTILISFVVVIIPTVFSAISTKTTIILIVAVKPSASIVLTLILVQEMLREGFTIPHVFHLLLSDVTPVSILGPVT